MTKISWIVETASGTVTHDVVLTDAQMTRFTSWVWDMRPQRNQDGTPKPKNVANVTTAVEQWAAGEEQQLRDDVKNHEGNALAETGRDGATGLD